MLQPLLEIVVPVFAIAALGYVLGRFAPASLSGVSELLLYAAIPALALDSLTRHSPSASDLLRLAAAACFVMLGTGAVAWLASRALRLPRRGTLLTSMFMNAGNFGVPLALLAWGQEGFAAAVLFYVTMSLAQASLGVWIAHGGSAGMREVLRLPLVYAVAVGLAVVFSGRTLPTLVATPLHMLAQVAIPLMLLSLGFALHQQRQVRWGLGLVAATLRIGVGVAFGILAAHVLDLHGAERKVVILASSMPAAVMNVVLSRRYDADPDVTASAVLISTLASLVTIPAVLWALG